jgi:hypothetical protein
MNRERIATCEREAANRTSPNIIRDSHLAALFQMRSGLCCWRSRPDHKIQSPLFPTDGANWRGITSLMPTYCRLGFRERATTEIPGARLGTRRTQLRVPSVEDPYVLLAIYYMIISMFTGCRHIRSYVVYLLSPFYRVPWLALYMQPA